MGSFLSRPSRGKLNKHSRAANTTTTPMNIVTITPTISPDVSIISSGTSRLYDVITPTDYVRLSMSRSRMALDRESVRSSADEQMMNRSCSLNDLAVAHRRMQVKK